MKFEDVGLHSRILRGVLRQGYTEATRIQAMSIPVLMAGNDLLACAQTGTGKTAAFALPVLHQLMVERDAMGPRADRAKGRPIRALVLTPTRELATQVHMNFLTYSRCTKLRSTVIYGGVSQHPQVQSLRSGSDVVIATPGRLLDLMNQGHVRLQDLSWLILDEADQMLDMGFIHDLKKIVSQAPEERQTMMFSATMPKEIRQLASRWLDNPEVIQAERVSSTPDRIKQMVTFVEKPKKPSTLVRFLTSSATGRTLVFCRTKRGADRVVGYLKRSNIHALAIHGDKTQYARSQAIERFCSPRPPVLVATDVAARGLHLPGVAHVINYDLPEIPETYVHRIGRTARAGEEGESISLCSSDERPVLKRIEALIRQSLKVQKAPREEDCQTPKVERRNEPEGVAEEPSSQRPRRRRGPGGGPGKRRSRPNGASRGSSNGASRGSSNGASRGSSNGASRGSSNGASRGSSNGASRGSSNGASRGSSNGVAGGAQRARSGKRSGPPKRSGGPKRFKPGQGRKAPAK
jgi:ATP-dependent RNA helicase RhlE